MVVTMISFLLRTAGQTLISTGVRYAITNEKLRNKIANSFKRSKKQKTTVKDLEKRLREIDGWINDTHQRLDEMENYNADYFKSMRDNIQTEIHDSKTGEVLAGNDSQPEQDLRSAEETHWAKVRNG
jgi:predicted transcriptional regulator